MVSQSIYTRIMEQVEYNPELKVWTLPGSCFKDSEPDYMFQFSSKYEAHKYVIAEMEKMEIIKDIKNK